MSTTFRVEAFIVPSLNRERNSENIIDDVKVAYKLREIDYPRTLECINEDSEFSDNSILDKSTENCEKFEDNEFSEHPIIKINYEKSPEIVADTDERNDEILAIEINSLNAQNLEEPIYEVPFSSSEKCGESDNKIEKLPPEINRIIKNQKIPLPNLPVCSSSPKLSTKVVEKFINKTLKICEKSDENVSKENAINLPVRINFSEEDSNEDDIEEPIYDIPYTCRQKPAPESFQFLKKLEKSEFISSERTERYTGNNYHPKPPLRSTSLMSIDERGETPDECFEQLCCNGLKYGCKTQKPQEVTDEIFQVNWMKRLENLRAREAVIKEKEAMLFDRERLLFKKEKELRILERLIKDKLKHAELCSKRVKHCDIGVFEGSKESLGRQLTSLESLESIKSDQVPSTKCLSGANDRATLSKINPADDRVDEGKIMKIPPNSRSSLVSSAIEPQIESVGLLHQGKSTCTGYSSIRRKRRPKPTYDDLDSTLSADIGDSSFVVTSRKFDPVIIKKPQAFTRSSSERRPHIEEEKVLKRISENIFVSQDKETKFLDYGLIDLGRGKDNENDEKRYSYLNLERGRFEKEKIKKGGKERPISWNEEQNAWLQRKRMAYNCTVRRMPTEDFDNKENLQKKEEAKKRVVKAKKFSIFR